MEATIKPESPYSAITACGGIIFGREQWTRVPAGQEQSALDNEYLLTRDFENTAPAIDEPAALPIEVDEVAPAVVDADEVDEPLQKFATMPSKKSGKAKGFGVNG